MSAAPASRRAPRPEMAAQPPLADILGNWSAGRGSLQHKLANALRAAVQRGELEGGLELPPERAVAQQLSVSRTTVFGAWQALKSEGLLESRQGSRTWVTTRAAHGAARERTRRSTSLRGLLSEGEPIDFTTGQLEGTPAIGKILRSLDDDALRPLLGRQRPFPQGLPGLREIIAGHFTADGVPTTPAQILITTGFQQAMTLVASVHLRPGDTAVTEDPTSPGALDVLRAAGVRLHSVPVGPHEWDMSSLAGLIAAQPQLAYLIPTYQNPTGQVLAGPHRRRIAHLASQAGVTLIEDLTHVGLGPTGTPPPIAGYAPEAPVISIGSMSKPYWSGLRIGWIRASERTIWRLTRLKTIADLGTPLLSQLVATRLLQQRDQILTERRAMLADRLEKLTSALTAHLPEWQWSPPQGGIALWVRVPGTSTTAFTQHALRYGVAVLPGPMLSPADSQQDHLRLCYHLPPELIGEGVRRLAEAWTDMRERGHRGQHAQYAVAAAADDMRLNLGSRKSLPAAL